MVRDQFSPSSVCMHCGMTQCGVRTDLSEVVNIDGTPAHQSSELLQRESLCRGQPLVCFSHVRFAFDCMPEW